MYTVLLTNKYLGNNHFDLRWICIKHPLKWHNYIKSRAFTSVTRIGCSFRAPKYFSFAILYNLEPAPTKVPTPPSLFNSSFPVRLDYGTCCLQMFSFPNQQTFRDHLGRLTFDTHEDSWTIVSFIIQVLTCMVYRK